MNYRYNNRWGLKDTTCTNTHYSINMDKIPDGNKQTFTPNMECELIVDFKGVVAVNNDLTSSVRKIRVLDYRKHFAGTSGKSFSEKLICKKAIINIIIIT